MEKINSSIAIASEYLSINFFLSAYLLLTKQTTIMTKGGAVYILTNKNNNILYTGVTNNLSVTMYQHKFNNYQIAFTSRYSVNKLVYYKGFHSILEAIAEEKRIKFESRKKKIVLVETENPNWEDLSSQF